MIEGKRVAPEPLPSGLGLTGTGDSSMTGYGSAT
ncbi:hypothetical protein SAMN05444167_3228 [Terriglobus roseus]|uniref:Uncharacterized protein n=1 Tax=Terriglobus roseus TaxID=392734 RepID=A0A1G7NSH8_9BACT|nr:hypothetical protein SAMN05444167_3228 [Terriglobus roseus]